MNSSSARFSNVASPPGRVPMGITGLAFLILGLVLGLTLLSGCGGEEISSEVRAKRLASPSTPIHLAYISAEQSEGPFSWRGVQIALDQAATANFGLNRTITIERHVSPETVHEGLLQVYDLLKNPTLAAVIDFSTSYAMMSKAILLQHHGALHIAPAEGDPVVDEHNLSLVFQMLPGDDELGRDMALFCSAQGWNRILLARELSFHGQHAGNAFDRQSQNLDMEIMGFFYFDQIDSREHFSSQLDMWQENHDFDALVIMGHYPAAAQMVHTARRLGFLGPILLSDQLDSPRFVSQLPPEEDNIFIASVFDPHNSHPWVRNFVQAYRQQFGQEPNTAAAMGYFSTLLFAKATQSADRTTPGEIAQQLKQYMPRLAAALRPEDPTAFTQQSFSFKVVSQGKMHVPNFESLP